MLLHEEVECWIRPTTDLETFASTLSKSRRWNLRKEHSAFIDAGLHLAVLPLTTDVCTRFAEMAAANSKRHGGTDDRTQLTQHIGQLVQHLGPDAMLLAALGGDQLVGGVLVIKHRRHLFVRLVGFDYDRTPGTFSYFVLMFLAPTILHEDLGDIDDVHLGVGALGTKLLHGARPEPLSTWIYDPQWL